MSEDLRTVIDWADGLLTKFSPAARRQLMRRIAVELRRANAQRIAANVSPDGEAFAPRKPRMRDRRDRGLRKRRMFVKLRTTHHLKHAANADAATVQFAGRSAHIAAVHHHGLRDRVTARGPSVQYAARPLLGFSADDIAAIRTAIEDHLASD